jgi:hypothetical protein
VARSSTSGVALGWDIAAGRLLEAIFGSRSGAQVEAKLRSLIGWTGRLGKPEGAAADTSNSHVMGST